MVGYIAENWLCHCKKYMILNLKNSHAYVGTRICRIVTFNRTLWDECTQALTKLDVCPATLWINWCLKDWCTDFCCHCMRINSMPVFPSPLWRSNFSPHCRHLRLRGFLSSAKHRHYEKTLKFSGKCFIYGKLLRHTDKVSLRFVLHDTLHKVFFTGYQEGNIIDNHS